MSNFNFFAPENIRNTFMQIIERINELNFHIADSDTMMEARPFERETRYLNGIRSNFAKIHGYTPEEYFNLYCDFFDDPANNGLTFDDANIFLDSSFSTRDFYSESSFKKYMSTLNI